jgi:hypothetical protein
MVIRNKIACAHTIAFTTLWLLYSVCYSAPFEIKVHDDLIANFEQSAYEVETNLYQTPASQNLKSNVFQTRLEYGYGITQTSELGANLYLSNNDGKSFINGGKISHMYIPTHDEEGIWHYGVKNEINYIKDIDANETTYYEFTPILGLHLYRWKFTLNPSVDVTLGRSSKGTFSPSAKLVYVISEKVDIGGEYYSDNLSVKGFYTPTQQPKTAYLVADIKYAKSALNFGVGKGVNANSDNWVVKLIGSFSF